MTVIPIVRTAHFLLYVDVLRSIGAPVDRDLARSRLPSWIEEKPESYVSLPLALDWVARCSREVSVAELGYLAARNMSLAKVDPALKVAVLTAPTTSARIDAISRLAHREDSTLVLWTRQEGPNIRVFCDMPGYRGTPVFGYAEWLNLQALASFLGAGAGRAWHPLEMTFVCRSQQCDAAMNTYGNTRILSGQPFSSILVASQVLTLPDLPPQDVRVARPPLAEIAEDWDFVSALRTVLRPYLCDAPPTLALAAEMSGMSKRTFQRRLAACDLSYSQVLEETRFEIARDMLVSSDSKIIDVAMVSGYQNPQHFSRAFRRVSGMSPKTYRQMVVENV